MCWSDGCVLQTRRLQAISNTCIDRYQHISARCRNRHPNLVDIRFLALVKFLPVSYKVSAVYCRLALQFTHVCSRMYIFSLGFSLESIQCSMTTFDAVLACSNSVAMWVTMIVFYIETLVRRYVTQIRDADITPCSSYLTI